MKYMIPEINISKFSEENIVTLSAAGQARKALEDANVTGANSAIVQSTLDDWVAQN